MAEKPKNKASIWKQRFENRQNKLNKMFDDTKKYYDIMYAVQNTSKISPWKSKVYVPVLASKAWDLIARMSDVTPYFNVIVKNEMDMDDETGQFYIPEDVRLREKRIEAKLHYDYQCGDEPMKLRVFDPLVDAVVAGTGYALVPWMLEETQKKARRFSEDGEMDNEHTVVKTSYHGSNGFEGINFFDVFPSDAPSWFKMPDLIIRGRKPLVDMEASGLYVNLDKCDTGVSEDITRSQFNNSRNRVVNEAEAYTKDDTEEQVSYFECYERTAKGVTLTTYAIGESQNGEDGDWIEIRPESVPYWHNMFPVVPFYCRKKSYSVFGESLFENNRTLQSATNDLFNHYLDNWNLSIDSMLMYEDGSLTNDFVIEPGGEISYTGEKPTQFKFPEPNPQQLSLVMDVLEKGVDAATFSPYATGTPSDGNDKTQGTAYGVKSITEAATTKIGFFRDNFKQSMKTVGRIWLSNLQQFQDDPEEVRQTINGQVVPDVVLPSDYQGEIELDIDDDSMVPLSKQDKADRHQQFITDLIASQNQAITQASIFKDFSDVPRYNWHNLLEETAEIASMRDFSRFMLDSHVEIPQEQQPDNTKELLNFSYKDAPPDIQAQIEQMYGLQPSATHDSTMVHTAIQQGAQQAQIENGDINGTRLDTANQPQPGGDTNSQSGTAASGSSSGQ